MLKCTLLSCFLLIMLACHAQSPDFISVKKRNGITIKHYFAGNPISFIAKDGRQYDAMIDKVAHDSLYLRYYQVYPYTNILGTVSYDTVTTYLLPFHYKNIRRINVPKVERKNSYINKLGTYAMLGGFGYDVLNVTNGLINKDKPLFDARNTRNVAIASAVGATGVLLKKIAGGKKGKGAYKIVYVNLDND